MKKYHLASLVIGALLAGIGLRANYEIRRLQARAIEVSRIGIDVVEAGRISDLVALPPRCEQLKLIVKRADPVRCYERYWLSDPSIDFEHVEKRLRLEPGDEVLVLQNELAALDCASVYWMRSDRFRGTIALKHLTKFDLESGSYHPPFRLPKIGAGGAFHSSTGSEGTQCYEETFVFELPKGLTPADLLDPAWKLKPHEHYRLEIDGWSRSNRSFEIDGRVFGIGTHCLNTRAAMATKAIRSGTTRRLAMRIFRVYDPVALLARRFFVEKIERVAQLNLLGIRLPDLLRLWQAPA